MSGPVKDPLRALQGARSRAQGGRLEEQVEASCTLLTETGRADISKTPEPMKPVSQPNKSGQFRAVYSNDRCFPYSSSFSPTGMQRIA